MVMVREEGLEPSILLCSESAPRADVAANFTIPAYFIKNFSFLDFQDAVKAKIIPNIELLFASLYKKEKT